MSRRIAHLRTYGICRHFVRCLLLLGALPPAQAAPRPKAKNDSFYFPSTVGDKLVFQNVHNGKKNEFTVEVIEVDKKHGRLAVTVAYYDDFLRVPLTLQYGLSLSGIDQLKAGGTSYSPAKPLLRIPAKSGDTWTWRRKSTNRKVSFKTVKEEVIEVPAGKFKTIRVETQDSDGKYTDWYALGLGSIRREVLRPGLADGVLVLEQANAGRVISRNS